MTKKEWQKKQFERALHVAIRFFSLYEMAPVKWHRHKDFAIEDNELVKLEDPMGTGFPIDYKLDLIFDEVYEKLMKFIIIDRDLYMTCEIQLCITEAFYNCKKEIDFQKVVDFLKLKYFV